MAERRKPEFAIQSGWWHDSDHLTADTRSWLEMHAAASGLDVAQQKLFIAHANQIAQTPHSGDEPIAVQCGQLEKLANDARRLLASLKALSQPTVETLTVYTREACVERPSPLPADMVERICSEDRARLLGEAWDWVSALEAAALYAIEQQEPSRQDKPKQARARGLVTSLADCYLRLTGKTPPADPAGWFGEFAGHLAQEMGLAVGPKILKSGIAQSKR